MKFNLKNRPAFTKRRYPKGTCAPDIEEMLDWFEGFEKELREKLEKYWKNPHGCHPTFPQLIEEILGDEYE